MSEKYSRTERTRHWQRLCDASCPICRDEAEASDQLRKTWFVDTGMQVRMPGGRVLPVLKAKDHPRLFAGEVLSRLNPSGAGGRVWSAMDLELLQYNIDFEERHDGDRDEH